MGAMHPLVAGGHSGCLGRVWVSVGAHQLGLGSLDPPALPMGKPVREWGLVSPGSEHPQGGLHRFPRGSPNSFMSGKAVILTKYFKLSFPQPGSTRPSPSDTFPPCEEAAK